MGGNGRVRTPGYLAFVWLVALAFSATGVGAVLEGRWSWPAVVVAVAPLLLAVRALHFGVEVTADQVVIKNLVRTEHLARDDVTRILPTGYDGFWTRWSAS